MEKENKVNKAMLNEKLSKYGVTKKTVYSIGSLIACILLIVVLSVTNASFNGQSLKTTEFWINFSILAGLCIYGMIVGSQTGEDTAKNNPNGAFRISLGKYGNIFSTIESQMLFAYFDEWVDFYRERKLKKKIEGLLKDNGIHQMEVLKLDLNELYLLSSPYKKTWKNGEETYFLSYTKEQIALIKYCISGNVKVSKLPRNFFLDVVYQSEKDMWESAARSSKKRNTYLSVSFVYKILALLAMCIISSGLEPGAINGQADVWLSLTKKIFCVLSAFVWGIFLGFEIVKIDKSYLDFKTDVLKQYYQEFQLKIYTPETIEEKAKKAYEEEMENEGK